MTKWERETNLQMRNWLKSRLAIDPGIFGRALDVLETIADNDRINARQGLAA